MENASHLVDSIKKLRQQSGCSSDELNQLQSIEAVLGLGTLVTAESEKNQSQFHKELANELYRWLSHPSNSALSRKHVIPLIDLYALYNCARGTADLVSPSDLMAAVKKLSVVAPKWDFTYREFRSGLRALQNTQRAAVESLERVIGLKVTKEDVLQRLNDAPNVRGPWLRGVDESRLAFHLNIGADEASEILEELEEDELLCRDESSLGVVIFYWNFFIV
jgi:ESCRT-II complex subunit VPS36